MPRRFFSALSSISYTLGFFIFVSALNAALPAFGADGSAEDFLNSIYIRYQGNPDTAHGIKLDNPAVIRAYFEPSLANLIINDDREAKKRGIVPKLDGDPFVDSQEWSLSNLSIVVKPHDKDTADGFVQFTNFDNITKLHYMLIHLASGWRIVNIGSSDDETSLRELYRTK